jgi:hypothetical protein
LFKYGVFCDFSPQTTRLAPAPNSAAKTVAAFQITGSATVKTTVKTTATRMQNLAVRLNDFTSLCTSHQPQMQIINYAIFVAKFSKAISVLEVQ